MRRRSNLRYSLKKSKESQIIEGGNKFANTMQASTWGLSKQSMTAGINEIDEKDKVMVTDQLDQVTSQPIQVRVTDEDIIIAELEKVQIASSYMGTSYA